MKKILLGAFTLLTLTACEQDESIEETYFDLEVVTKTNEVIDADNPPIGKGVGDVITSGDDENEGGVDDEDKEMVKIYLY